MFSGAVFKYKNVSFISPNIYYKYYQKLQEFLVLPVDSSLCFSFGYANPKNWNMLNLTWIWEFYQAIAWGFVTWTWQVWTGQGEMQRQQNEVHSLLNLHLNEVSGEGKLVSCASQMMMRSFLNVIACMWLYSFTSLFKLFQLHRFYPKYGKMDRTACASVAQM